MDMKPQELTAVEVVFPVDVSRLMPKMQDIPAPFQRGSTKWNRLFADMFYSGVTDLKLTPKDGIDKTMALRHIKAISHSFEPKHEHKAAAVAYLFSLWFDEVGASWKVAKSA